MSLNRFLSRRDKSKNRRDVRSIHTHFNGSFTDSEPSKAEIDSQKIKDIHNLLCKEQVGTFSSEDIKYAMGLSYTNGDVHKTVEFLKFLQDSQDLIVTPYDPDIKFLGSVNRNMTTCYLDSLLFAMFGCHDSYEPMLVNRFESLKRNRLAMLLRLWVNTLRSGKLVTTDITKQIQDALAECGWPEAAEVRQQDAGEAFTFITEQLGLPNLYLKMDLFHHGKEDVNDDHKIVQERLLEMPIPDPVEDRPTVTLEDCAEAALNAKVEVRRYLEGRQRKNTATSIKSQRSFDSTKEGAVHIESVEIKESEPTTPTSMRAQSPPLYEHPRRPMTLQHRTPSIIQESIVSIPGSEASGSQHSNSTRVRAGSVRKEVMIPAWQMYSLIPFHTDYSPENDAQVAHHLKLKQPTFGIRLKRYGFSQNGHPTRKETKIDIPTDMAFPTFIRDDSSDDSSNGFGKFKLSLQSAVCHRGNSTESGHYVSLARGQTENGRDRWLIFDDLALDDRVKEVDIEKALEIETPYLLFYQVQPIDGNKSPQVPESIGSVDHDSGVAGLSSVESGDKSSNERPSFDDTSSNEGTRGRASRSFEGRRRSIAFVDEGLGGTDDNGHKGHHASNSLTIPQRTSSKPRDGSKSRPTSSGGQGRLSTSLNRLTGKRTNSNEAINGVIPQASKPGANTMADVVIKAQEKEKAKQRKKEEKSRSRSHHLSKHKHNSNAPDRECILM